MLHPIPTAPEPELLALRPATASDDDELMQIEAGLCGPLQGTRGLSDDAVRRLSALNLRSRAAAWRAAFPNAACWVITSGGGIVGRLWADPSGKAWKLLDLALLPQCRGLGLGTAALRQWLAAADRAGAATLACVAARNPFVLHLRALGYNPGRVQRGQVWLHRRPAEAMHDWDEPTMPLAA